MTITAPSDQATAKPAPVAKHKRPQTFAETPRSPDGHVDIPGEACIGIPLGSQRRPTGEVFRASVSAKPPAPVAPAAAEPPPQPEKKEPEAMTPSELAEVQRDRKALRLQNAKLRANLATREQQREQLAERARQGDPTARFAMAICFAKRRPAFPRQ